MQSQWPRSPVLQLRGWTSRSCGGTSCTEALAGGRRGGEVETPMCDPGRGSVRAGPRFLHFLNLHSNKIVRSIDVLRAKNLFSISPQGRLFGRTFAPGVERLARLRRLFKSILHRYALSRASQGSPSNTSFRLIAQRWAGYSAASWRPPSSPFRAGDTATVIPLPSPSVRAYDRSPPQGAAPADAMQDAICPTFASLRHAGAQGAPCSDWRSIRVCGSPPGPLPCKAADPRHIYVTRRAKPEPWNDCCSDRSRGLGRDDSTNLAPRMPERRHPALVRNDQNTTSISHASARRAGIPPCRLYTKPIDDASFHDQPSSGMDLPGQGLPDAACPPHKGTPPACKRPPCC